MQGVGSHAAHLLLRSGVGRLRLIDFDQVTLSSLNRHAVATRADVGIPKATCLQRHFQDILPEVGALLHLTSTYGLQPLSAHDVSATKCSMVYALAVALMHLWLWSTAG